MRNASSANSFAGDASYFCIVSDREYTVFSLALATYVFICSQGGGILSTQREEFACPKGILYLRAEKAKRKLFSRSTGGRKEIKKE